MSEATKITVNGREYDSVDQMPPDVRQLYLQAMVALRESGTNETPGVMKKEVVKESFIYNGREYKSLDELPTEVRGMFEKLSSLPPQVTDVEIKTDKTIIPGTLLSSSWEKSNDRPERDPKIAWMLVSALAVVVVILLFLLYLSSISHK